MSRPLREIEPTWTSRCKLYSNQTIECLERLEDADETASRISGRSSRSGRWSWLVRGSALEVVNTRTGQRLAAWRFGWSTDKKLSYSITCVEELPSGDGLYLIVGLRSTGSSSKGMVCLFDPNMSRVVKAIVIPMAVTAVECVTSGVDAPQHSISDQLDLMCGVVAVGMESGHVYLIDIRLDDEMEEFDEWNPSQLQIIDAENSNVVKQRKSAKAEGARIAFELGAECHMLGSFSYASPDGEILANFSSSDVSISSLKYVRQLGSLIVGYNFGCFQVWDLEQHCREFSSSVGVYALPVTHVVYQEPENDPRLCCYLWIARAQSGNDEDEIIECPTTITLYQLNYESKEILPGYGRVLKEFSGCGGRFEHQLTGDPYHLADATTCGSKILCFYTLETTSAVIDVTRSEDSADDVVPHDLTLATCIWEAPSADLQSSPTCHLAVFDINRWYHSQMPASIRDAMYGSKYPTCPFFSVCSLAEILNAGNPDALIDVLLRPNEIGRFSSMYGTTPEQFLWASSLTFDIICLMETGIVRANFHGTQQQVLDDLNMKGVTALSEAHDYFHRCWAASLMPKHFDFSRAQEKTFQVESLLSVALEHNQPSFIISCINKLGEDNITYAGCNLRIILEWAWDQVIQIKQHLDQLCVPLFDGTGIFVDQQLVAILDHYGVQLGNLVDIFKALSLAAPTTEQGLKEIESQYTVTYLLHQYLQVVLFFMKHGLLPELFDNNDESELSSQYYPGEVIARQYDARRRELERADTDSLGSLMIDRVVSLVTGEADPKIWETEEEWSQRYPPPNLHALASLILLEKVNPMSKLCIIYYSLLDLCSLNPQFRTKKVAERFAATFGLQPVLTNLFRGFWFLDHKDFKNALNLLTISACELDVATWQNSHIVRLLLNQDEAKKALLFIRSVKPTMNNPEDVQLHLSVLIKNGLVNEAFQFQRECRDPERRQRLLEYFFIGCHQTKNTNKILELPLNKVEEEQLVRFLEDSPFSHARELLVMFYLQRGFYVQAIRLNEKLKHDVMSDPAAQHRAAVRNVIIQKYFNLLPKMQQELALRPDKSMKGKSTKYREVPRPRPLSTIVNHKIQSRVMSQSAVVNAALEKIAENRAEEEASPNTAPFTGTPSARKPKSLLSDSHDLSFPKTPRQEAVIETKERPAQPSPLQSINFSPVSSLLRKDRARKLFKGANALHLLQTPPVTKHLSFAATPNPVQSLQRPIATPHSILKPTRISRRSPSPSQISPSLPPRVRRISGERVPWTEPGSDNEEADVSSHKKQIRFKSPSPPSLTSGSDELLSFTSTSYKLQDRIPEEDGDMMETEAGSVGEQSSTSDLDFDNEPGMEASTSEIKSNEAENDRDGNVKVAVVELDHDTKTDKDEMVEPSDHDVKSGGDDDDEGMVVAVVDLDEDLDEQENMIENKEDVTETVNTESTAADIIKPSVVAPSVFMNKSNADETQALFQLRTTTTSPSTTTLSPYTTTTPDQPPIPRDTTPPAPATTDLNPATTSNSPPRESPDRRCMPIRDETPDHSSVATGKDTPEQSTLDFKPDLSSSGEFSEVRIPEIPPIGQQPSAESLSHDEDHLVSRISPEKEPRLSPDSSHISLPSSRITPSQTRVKRSPAMRGAEAVSAMTPPISPPNRGSSVSPRIYLDDINSPKVGSSPGVRMPRQPELRKSPSRTTPAQTSSPSRRSARLNTPHQSPTDSPISFVTPLRTSMSPRRKSGQRKKPIALASHGMTLRTRACTNKTTRCAKLPNTN